MVCIAAFIILCLSGVIVAFLSIFKREIGRKYLLIFKKSWHCVFKKVRLQKCDTNFKDDVKNTILKRVILKKPKLVKPLSIFIEAISVIIVFITVWSLIISIKSLLALWVFGTCNVTKPSACSLTSDVCSIDAEEPTNFLGKIGRSFEEWGEIFSGIPDRLKTWGQKDLEGIKKTILLNPTSSFERYDEKNNAYDIIDPGCTACLNAYNKQKNSDFYQKHKTFAILYPIKNPNGSTRFKNSEIATSYLIAVEELFSEKHYSAKIIDRLFTGFDESNISYQVRLNNDYSEVEVIERFNSWLKEYGANDSEIEKIKHEIYSEKIKNIITNNRKIVDEKIRTKSIPTLIYDGRKNHS